MNIKKAMYQIQQQATSARCNREQQASDVLKKAYTPKREHISKKLVHTLFTLGEKIGNGSLYYVHCLAMLQHKRDLQYGLTFEWKFHSTKAIAIFVLPVILQTQLYSLTPYVAISFLFHVHCLHIPTQPSQQSEQGKQGHSQQLKLVHRTTSDCQKWSPDQFWLPNLVLLRPLLAMYLVACDCPSHANFKILYLYKVQWKASEVY